MNFSLFQHWALLSSPLAERQNDECWLNLQVTFSILQLLSLKMLFLSLYAFRKRQGKTTLIKALTDEAKMQPEDRLFATLDVTAHPGKLPSGMMVLFLDTVGFVSDLPPELVESFSATLEDITDSVCFLIGSVHHLFGLAI